MEICYSCDRPATTKEHVPPQSFFPKGHRTNLITVPSCELHNNGNSEDVEYTRNVISIFHGVNPIGEQHFLDKGMRSLNRRNAALLYRTFSDIRPISIQGKECGMFTTDVSRIETVMSACLTALHFRETGEKVTAWHVTLPNLGMSTSDVPPEGVAAWRDLLSLFTRMTFQSRQTDSPDIFQYEVAELIGGRVYRMMFYTSFAVYGAKAESQPGQS